MQGARHLLGASGHVDDGVESVVRSRPCRRRQRNCPYCALACGRDPEPAEAEERQGP